MPFELMLAVLLSAFVFCGFRLRFLLWLFQQDEYEASSFAKTVCLKARLLDKKLVLPLVIIGIGAVYFPWAALLSLALFVGFAWREIKVMQSAKKKLAVTNRAKRIYSVSIILTAGLFYLSWVIVPSFFIFTSAGIIFFLPLVLILANILLFPLEAYYRKGFIKSAKKKLSDMGLKYTVIGSGDKVIRQMPSSGAVVNSGSVVVLYTEDVGDNLVTVPDVTGKALAQVKSRLSSAGLNLSIVGAGATGSSSERTVVATQTPHAGEKVPQGSIVKVEFRFKDVEGTVD